MDWIYDSHNPLMKKLPRIWQTLTRTVHWWIENQYWTKILTSVNTCHWEFTTALKKISALMDWNFIHRWGKVIVTVHWWIKNTCGLAKKHTQSTDGLKINTPPICHATENLPLTWKKSVHWWIQKVKKKLEHRHIYTFQTCSNFCCNCDAKFRRKKKKKKKQKNLAGQ